MKTRDILIEQGFDYGGEEMNDLAYSVAGMLTARAQAFLRAEPDMEVDPSDIVAEQLEVFIDLVNQKLESM